MNKPLIKIYSLLGFLLVALSGCQSNKVASTAKPAPPESNLNFSHPFHAEQGVTCDACHGGVETSLQLGTAHLPDKNKCAECHDIKDQAKCSVCHRDPAQAIKLNRQSSTKQLLFSHKAHMTRAKDCVACHTGAAVATSVENITRPRMKEECLTCHEHRQQYRQVDCKKCHQSLAQYPIKFISAFNHEGNFLAEHAKWARSSSKMCTACHGQSFCADCHTSRNVLPPAQRAAQRVERQFIHRGDFRTKHSLEGKADSGQCLRCHSPKSCSKCHREQGVSADALKQSGLNRNPHPTGWLTPASPNSHGAQARRRISQCASCHDQGALSNCVRCHKTAAKGGMGLSPHPAGWDRGGRSKNEMCQICH